MLLLTILACQINEMHRQRVSYIITKCISCVCMYTNPDLCVWTHALGCCWFSAYIITIDIIIVSPNITSQQRKMVARSHLRLVGGNGCGLGDKTLGVEGLGDGGVGLLGARFGVHFSKQAFYQSLKGQPFQQIIIKFMMHRDKVLDASFNVEAFNLKAST